jgi:hypothetical protein
MSVRFEEGEANQCQDYGVDLAFALEGVIERERVQEFPLGPPESRRKHHLVDPAVRRLVE